MATIFEKLPASGEKCLILDPKESLIYPFDFGDWTELRASICLSFTQADDNNSFISSESIPASSSVFSSMYIGLFSGENGLLSDFSFVGFGNRTGTAIYVTNSVPGGGSTAYADIMINDSRALSANITSNPLMSGFSYVNGDSINRGYGTTTSRESLNYFTVGTTAASSSPPYLTISGDVNFSKIESLIFTIVNKNLPGQYFNLTWNNNGASSSYTNTSIEQLSTNNLAASSTSSITGLYYNSDLSPTGSALQIPDKFIIYFPFSQNRVRIHSLLLEKYG